MEAPADPGPPASAARPDGGAAPRGAGKGNRPRSGPRAPTRDLGRRRPLPSPPLPGVRPPPPHPRAAETRALGRPDPAGGGAQPLGPRTESVGETFVTCFCCLLSGAR